MIDEKTILLKRRAQHKREMKLIVKTYNDAYLFAEQRKDNAIANAEEECRRGIEWSHGVFKIAKENLKKKYPFTKSELEYIEYLKRSNNES